MASLTPETNSERSRKCPPARPRARADTHSRGTVAGNRIFCLLVLAVSSATFGLTHGAEIVAPSEQQLKALIVRESARFFHWPEDAFSDAASPMILGILGRDPFGSDLEVVLKDRKIKGRNVVVRRSAQIGILMNSHILFISSSETARLSRILAAAEQRPILTVGDMNEFAERGGIVYLRMERGKVVFELNRAAATQARLNINAQLLQLAKKIHTKAPQVEK